MASAAAAVKADFHFVQCHLRSLHFELVVGHTPGAEYGMQLESTSEVLSTLDPDGNTIANVILFLAVPSVEEAGFARAPYKLRTEIQGTFLFPPDFDMGRRTNVLCTHAPALLYSQLRPVVRTVTAEAGHMLVLPLINVAATLVPKEGNPAPDSARD